MAIKLTESRLRQIIREEAKNLTEWGRVGYRRRGYGGGGGGYGGGARRGSSESDMINHIMDDRGVDYEEAEQILTDIYDDVGHDLGLVKNAVYGNPNDDFNRDD